MDTAATLFLEHSYERATMRSIGAAVGIDPATIYYYFASKEAIVVEILEQGVDNLLSALQVAIHDNDTVESQFRSAVHAHVVHAITGPYQPLYDQVFRYLPEEARAGVRAKRDLIDDTWRDVVERAVAAGLITVDNPSLARLHLITAMNGIYRWYRPGGPLAVDEIAMGLVQLVGAPADSLSTPIRKGKR